MDFDSIPDYNHFVPEAFANFGYDVTYHPGCLIMPYGQYWQVDMPVVDWQDHSIVIMHAQDFLTVRQGRCPELDAIQQAFGSRADRVVVLVWNRDLDRVYQGPLKLVYFPSHSINFIKGVWAQRSRWQAAFGPRSQHKWQCLSGTIKEHRRRTVRTLPPGGCVSLGSEIMLDGMAYHDYDYDNVENWLRLLPVYRDCAVNIVTETIYDFSPGIISEKTLQAWLSLQVPIMIGHRGLIQQCRDLGFDMFDDVVDNSHDLLPDDQRVEAAILANQDLILHGVGGLDHRLRINQQRVLNDWPADVINGFFRRVIDIHKTLSKS